jgi:predicted O-methyltransferase YrrM
LGDSRKTVPTYLQQNPDTKFDVIFIDGGHSYEIANADMENCFLFAHPDTIVILDDTMFTAGWVQIWNQGPNRVWTEYLQQHKIEEIKRADYGSGRGMSWGKYIHSNFPV